ncbi:predicted protein [Sclerotinia sclerotiorum 1980 UF-70]|uniref:Uncharacterized protein n=1 Tax=Sclerotinia sclerotiorum (strain ATCC 18683 / 1980 / Ss-1) TaxID=665079 RepID=A7EHF6_SCLS1|nr:predicted protein [Sclerotinia sclerotiorum 1980 UF-70]EDO02272.1 predicted protein [Sclerotinia sclerotiorum 1980 UF-70]
MATPSPPNLSKTLSDKASNLLNKVNDAQSIFNPVTQLLDTYLGSEEVRALPPSPKPSYIQKASTPIIALTNKIPSNNRLFIQINQIHPARSAGSFVILTALKKVLGPNASLLREVQKVKTGFALCTSSTTNLLALEKQKAIISSAIGDCKIEAQEKWTIYRLNYVPKEITIFNDQFKIDSILITKDTISNTIKEYSDQIVSFKTGAEPLKKNLKILGANISISLLIQKPKITQCNCCFQ